MGVNCLSSFGGELGVDSCPTTFESVPHCKFMERVVLQVLRGGRGWHQRTATLKDIYPNETNAKLARPLGIS